MLQFQICSKLLYWHNKGILVCICLQIGPCHLEAGFLGHFEKRKVTSNSEGPFGVQKWKRMGLRLFPCLPPLYRTPDSPPPPLFAPNICLCLQSCIFIPSGEKGEWESRTLGCGEVTGRMRVMYPVLSCHSSGSNPSFAKQFFSSEVFAMLLH